MITQEQKNKLRIAFLEIYEPNIPRIDLKRKYGIKVASLNLPGCTPCQTNHTFSEFAFQAEDMSSEEIQSILTSNSTDMPIKKTAKKADTKKATKAVVKPKKTPKAEVKTKVAPAKEVEVVKETIAKAAVSTPKAVEKPKTRDISMHGGIKFLYIPKRK